MTTRRSIAQAYAAGELSDFFGCSPADLNSTRTARRDVDRAGLSEALRAYHRDLGTLDRSVETQLARLAHPNSRVVVTGQQAGLLTGPAYSVHKGADAVLRARSLDQDEAPVVAVYWIASQDHDAAEVASTTLLDMNEALHHLTLDLPLGVPVGRIPWREEWTHEVEALLERFAAPEAHRLWLGAVLRAAMREGSYADVFARLVHSLLGEFGLLVLDPLHPALTALFAPALARELDRPREGPQRIEEAARALEARGYVAQLRRPEGATNLFLEGEDGQRRLLRWDGRFFEADRRYDRQQLQRILESNPGRITPAAGLRPILQDSILPTAAFVVGPGEIAYCAELRGVYDLHGVPQPVLLPRLSVTWLEPPVVRLLQRFGLTAAAFQAAPHDALGSALARERGAAALAEDRLGILEREFSQLMQEIGNLDPTLSGAVQRTRERTLTRLIRLQSQARRALIDAEQTREGQVGRLYAHLLPRGVAQEREMNFLTYLLKHGRAPLKRLMTLAPGWTGPVEI
nr:bacillithiol biosynthesis cysteine-adding enzyme BshC [Deinococcus peraridilitoris]